MGDALPAWQIASRLGVLLEQGREKLGAGAVMLDIVKNVPEFKDCRYKNLAQVEVQYPLIGRDDVYYGGTAYDNTGGLGVQIPTTADNGNKVKAGKVNSPEAVSAGKGELVIVPTRELYNRERVFRPSIEAMMAPRVPSAYVALNPADADKLGVTEGDAVNVTFGSASVSVTAVVGDDAPEGVHCCRATSRMWRHRWRLPSVR
jgi:NADH-quinone oxidoreductase subunit G